MDVLGTPTQAGWAEGPPCPGAFVVRAVGASGDAYGVAIETGTNDGITRNFCTLPPVS